MRLIDATALKRKVLEWMPSDPCGREEKEYPFETDIVVSLMMEIDEAPTIDINRPQGEWNKGYADELCLITTYTCSECGSMELSEFKYCPNCGAYMRGEK